MRVWTFGYCCNLLHLKCKYEGVLVYSKIQTKNLLNKYFKYANDRRTEKRIALNF